MTLHCAQRGCLIPDGTLAIEGMLCPTCNNPLHVVRHDDADHEAAEVSHEKPADDAEPAEDFTAGIDEDDEQPLFDENGQPLFAVPPASASESDMVG